MRGSSSEPGSPAGADTTGRIVIALFEERAGAERAIRDLKDAGFSNEQIGAAVQDALGTGNPADEETFANGTGQSSASLNGLTDGATAGALTGGVIGGLLGMISSLLVPGLGPLIVGGVLASTIMGLGVGAATGGLIGALIGMGVPEEDARYFDAGLRQGMTLVTVNATENAAEALTILERHGADLGPSRTHRAQPTDSYGGRDRRSASVSAYTGPERRLAGV
jgi:hypothetical protein